MNANGNDNGALARGSVMRKMVDRAMQREEWSRYAWPRMDAYAQIATLPSEDRHEALKRLSGMRMPQTWGNGGLPKAGGLLVTPEVDARALRNGSEATPDARSAIEEALREWEPPINGPEGSRTYDFDPGPEADEEDSNDTRNKPLSPNTVAIIAKMAYFNARRLVARYGKNIRFTRGGVWFVSDDTRWKLDEGRLTVRRYCIETIHSLLQDITTDDSLKRWSKSMARSVIEEMQYFAQTRVTINRGDMDLNPWLFNCPNGTLDLRTGELRKHRRDDWITKISPVPYDPDARAPRFERFIGEVFANHPELIPYVQKLLGYALTGETREPVLTIFYGPSGANGKSTLLRVVKHVMGDYGVTASSSWFMKGNMNNPENAAPGLASLAGSRFVYVSEIESGRRLNTALIKGMTGGDPIIARTLYEKPF